VMQRVFSRTGLTISFRLDFGGLRMDAMKTKVFDWTGCSWVESVAERMHGTPVLIGTRMDADGVVLNFDGGMTIDELIEDYGLDEDKVRGILSFAGRLSVPKAA
jgi:uncharacterized protein (DUF433 family)